MDPQARGYAFESFLKDAFDAYGLSARAAFRLKGAQINGSFERDRQTPILPGAIQWIQLHPEHTFPPSRRVMHPVSTITEAQPIQQVTQTLCPTDRSNAPASVLSLAPSILSPRSTSTVVIWSKPPAPRGWRTMSSAVSSTLETFVCPVSGLRFSTPRATACMFLR